MGFVRRASQDTITNNIGAFDCVYPAAPIAGNLLIAVMTNGRLGTGNNRITSEVWDTVLDQAMNTNARSMTMFSRIADGTESAIHFDPGNPNAHCSADIFEYSGNANPTVIDAAAVGTTSGGAGATSLATGAITTSLAGDLIFSAAGNFDDGGSAAWVTSTVIGNNELASRPQIFCGQYIPGTTVTGFSDTASWTASLPVSTIIVAFKAGGSAAVYPSAMPMLGLG